MSVISDFFSRIQKQVPTGSMLSLPGDKLAFDFGTSLVKAGSRLSILEANPLSHMQATLKTASAKGPLAAFDELRSNELSKMDSARARLTSGVVELPADLRKYGNAGYRSLLSSAAYVRADGYKGLLGSLDSGRLSLTSTLNDAKDVIVSDIDSARSSLTRSLSSGYKVILSDLDSARESVTKSGNSAKDSVVERTNEIKETVIRTTNTVKDNFLNATNSGKDVFLNATNSGKDAVVSGVNSGKDALVGGLNDTKDSLLDTLGLGPNSPGRQYLMYALYGAVAIGGTYIYGQVKE
jgi:hypothetical protein